MQFFDTHCHIHSVDYPIPLAEVDEHNRQAGTDFLVCVGVDAEDSERAVRFVADRPNSWAAIGQHPHEAKYGMEPLKRLRALLLAQSPTQPVVVGSDGGVSGRVARDALSLGEGQEEGGRHGRKIVAIGECGLDYFYGHSSKEDQEKALRYQIELALEYNLPQIFHVREAFDDFWPIFDSYQGIRGVLHSYTDDSANLFKALERGLYIGVNGIMTFTKNDWQLEVARQIPLDKMLLETDAPFLTPMPLRGKVNEPAHVRIVAQFMSDLRQMSLTRLAQHTTTNARQLFSI